jgi:hypothetical protein
MGGALLMTVGAVDSGDDGNGRSSQASDALAQLGAELSVATAFTNTSSNDIAFSIPDRDGDGAPETVEYTWSGIAGDPILRTFNNGKPFAAISDVQSCSLAFADRPAAVKVTSAEQILMSCDSPSGASTQSFNVDNNSWAAQYVRPTLPSNAVSWSITRVRVVLKQSGTANGSLYLGIRAADAALKPTTTVLGYTTVAESSLSTSMNWFDISLGPITGLAPTQGVFINVRGASSSGTDCVVQYVQGSSQQPMNSHYVTTSNGGSTWTSPNDNQDMRFILYGTITTLQEP